MAEDRIRPRRQDRAMPSEAHIEAFLERAPFGFLATSVEDQPYVSPKLFWYEKATRRIYFHSAMSGRTRDSLLLNPQVCFSTAELGRLLPSENACEFGIEYASVCVFGRARFVENQDEKKHGLRGLLQKFTHELQAEDPEPALDPEQLQRTAVYAIEIDSWSGKQRSAEA
ncbi:MAG TPA: pyridoxamine 5'-phosphate oxidase family protein [Anaerolineae bacterium]|nr:pyridoxamine 5'-phosphate oxidase family protein [Anaerolineae bacterium]